MDVLILPMLDAGHHTPATKAKAVSELSESNPMEYSITNEISAIYMRLRAIIREEANARRKLDVLLLRQKEEAIKSVWKAQEYLAFVNEEQARMQDVLREETEVANAIEGAIASGLPDILDNTPIGSHCGEIEDFFQQRMNPKIKEHKFSREIEQKELASEEQTARRHEFAKELECIARVDKEARIQTKVEQGGVPRLREEEATEGERKQKAAMIAPFEEHRVTEAGKTCQEQKQVYHLIEKFQCRGDEDPEAKRWAEFQRRIDHEREVPSHRRPEDGDIRHLPFHGLGPSVFGHSPIPNEDVDMGALENHDIEASADDEFPVVQDLGTHVFPPIQSVTVISTNDGVNDDNIIEMKEASQVAGPRQTKTDDAECAECDRTEDTWLLTERLEREWINLKYQVYGKMLMEIQEASIEKDALVIEEEASDSAHAELLRDWERKTKRQRLREEGIREKERKEREDELVVTGKRHAAKAKHVLRRQHAKQILLDFQFEAEKPDLDRQAKEELARHRNQMRKSRARKARKQREYIPLEAFILPRVIKKKNKRQLDQMMEN